MDSETEGQAGVGSGRGGSVGGGYETHTRAHTHAHKCTDARTPTHVPKRLRTKRTQHERERARAEPLPGPRKREATKGRPQEGARKREAVHSAARKNKTDARAHASVESRAPLAVVYMSEKKAVQTRTPAEVRGGSGGPPAYNPRAHAQSRSSLNARRHAGMDLGEGDGSAPRPRTDAATRAGSAITSPLAATRAGSAIRRHLRARVPSCGRRFRRRGGPSE